MWREDLTRRTIIIFMILFGCVIIGLGLISQFTGPIRWNLAGSPEGGRPFTVLTIEDWSAVLRHFEDAPGGLTARQWRVPGVCRGNVVCLNLKSMTGAGSVIMITSVHVRLWAPALLLLLYPTFTIIRSSARRNRRRRKGLCINCGYNLTGNLTGVCPECGRQI